MRWATGPRDKHNKPPRSNKLRGGYSFIIFVPKNIPQPEANLSEARQKLGA